MQQQGTQGSRQWAVQCCLSLPPSSDIFPWWVVHLVRSGEPQCPRSYYTNLGVLPYRQGLKQAKSGVEKAEERRDSRGKTEERKGEGRKGEREALPELGVSAILVSRTTRY